MPVYRRRCSSASLIGLPGACASLDDDAADGDGRKPSGDVTRASACSTTPDMRAEWRDAAAARPIARRCHGLVRGRALPPAARQRRDRRGGARAPRAAGALAGRCRRRKRRPGSRASCAAAALLLLHQTACGRCSTAGSSDLPADAFTAAAAAAAPRLLRLPAAGAPRRWARRSKHLRTASAARQARAARCRAMAPASTRERADLRAAGAARRSSGAAPCGA